VATYDPRRLYLHDLRTGRPRWHADTFVTQGSFPLVSSTSIVLTEGSGHVAVVARDTATGRVRWRDPVSGASEGFGAVLAAGPLAILQGGMPTFVQVPPVLASGGVLVQPADPQYACI
jgi:outer membrane protein assembly factor BamB